MRQRPERPNRPLAPYRSRPERFPSRWCRQRRWRPPAPNPGREPDGRYGQTARRLSQTKLRETTLRSADGQPNCLGISPAATGWSLMTMQKMIVSEFGWDERYRVAQEEVILTPALIVYPEIIASNIQAMLRLLDGDGDR